MLLTEDINSIKEAFEKKIDCKIFPIAEKEGSWRIWRMQISKRRNPEKPDYVFETLEDVKNFISL